MYVFYTFGDRYIYLSIKLSNQNKFQFLFALFLLIFIPSLYIVVLKVL